LSIGNASNIKSEQPLGLVCGLHIGHTERQF